MSHNKRQKPRGGHQPYARPILECIEMRATSALHALDKGHMTQYDKHMSRLGPLLVLLDRTNEIAPTHMSEDRDGEPYELIDVSHNNA